MAVLIVVIYIALTFLLGFILNKRSKDTKELFVAKNQLSVLLLVPLLFGEIIAGASTTGSAQGGFTQGISAIWVFVGKGFGCLVFAVLFGEFFTRAGKAGIMSVPEAFNWRFDAKVRYVMIFIVLVPLFLVCSSQCKAAASLLSPMLGIEVNVTICIVGVIFGILALAGLKGLAKMNILHSCLIFFGVMFVALVCTNSQGGFAELKVTVPAGYWDLTHPSIWEITGQLVSATLAFMVAVTPANACYSSDNLRTSRASLCIAGALAMVFSFFPVLIGLCGKVAIPGADANTVLYTMPATLSPALAGLATMAVLAAVLSTAPFLFLSCSTIVIRDILLPIKGSIPEQTQMKMTVLITAIFTAVAIYFAINTSSIFNQIIGANHIKSMAAFVLIVSLFWKRLTNWAAFWALLISGFLSTLWYFEGSVFGLAIEPLWPALTISALLMIMISFADKKHSFKDYAAYKARDEAVDVRKIV